MKKLVLVATVALAIIAATASTAQARGYTCIYRGSGIYVVIDGSDNAPMFCRAFAKGGFGQRVYWASGRTYCAWAYNAADVRLTVRSPSRMGRAFCILLAGRVPQGFYRIR